MALPSTFVINRDSVEPFDAAALKSLPRQQQRLEVAFTHPEWWARNITTLAKLTSLSVEQVREYCKGSSHIARAPLDTGEYYSHITRLQELFPDRYPAAQVDGSAGAGDSRGMLSADTISGPKRPLKVFLGSSTAAKAQAKVVLRTLASPEVEFLPWWEAFTPARTLFEELDALGGRVDAALLLFSPESDSTIRGNSVRIPNLNVLFEFGYFSGRLERYKIGMLRYGDFYLPSDLDGYIHITGSRTFRRGRSVQVGQRTKQEFDRWIAGLSDA